MPKGDTHVKKHNKGKLISKNVNNDLKIPNESEGERIGEITGTLGNCRFNVKLLNDDIEVQASASRSFSHGPNKEIIRMKDYVVIQPGISRNQYHINHKYADNEIQKLYDLNHIGKPKQSITVDKTDIFEDHKEEEHPQEITFDDVWDI